jgi:hypothetical protein
MAKPTRLLQAKRISDPQPHENGLSGYQRVLMDGSRLSLHSWHLPAVPPLECNRSIAHIPYTLLVRFARHRCDGTVAARWQRFLVVL